jgi:hypothetical protein
MRTLILSLSAALLLAGCACGPKKPDSAVAGTGPDAAAADKEADPGHVPSILEPNHGMSGAKAAGFGAASDFLK